MKKLIGVLIIGLVLGASLQGCSKSSKAVAASTTRVDTEPAVGGTAPTPTIDNEESETEEESESEELPKNIYYLKGSLLEIEEATFLVDSGHVLELYIINMMPDFEHYPPRLNFDKSDYGRLRLHEVETQGTITRYWVEGASYNCFNSVAFWVGRTISVDRANGKLTLALSKDKTAQYTPVTAEDFVNFIQAKSNVISKCD